MKKSQKLLLLSIVLALASWVVPTLNLVCLPLQYLYTHLHELSHALAAIITGGGDITIKVFADGSGVTTSMGGWPLIVSPAGYVGATVLGSAILFASTTPRGAKACLLTVAVTLAAALVIWIRGDVVGVTTAAVGALLLWVAGSKLKEDNLVFCGQFLGAYLCLASLQAVFSIFGFGSVAMMENDAVILQHETGIPAQLSALVWASISVLSVGAMLVRSWKHEERAARP